MGSQTFRLRLAKLRQKSRRALRLYTRMGRFPSGNENPLFTELQLEEWKTVNADLVEKLGHCIEDSNTRRVACDIYSLRDFYQNGACLTENVLLAKQNELLSAAQQGDFVKAALTSRELISLKARFEANRAAHHELQLLLRRSRIVRPSEDQIDSAIVPQIVPVIDNGNVIPLRRRS